MNSYLVQSTEFYIIIGALALLIDVIVPDFGFVWRLFSHPVTIIGKCISLFDSVLNRGGKNVQLLLGGLTTLSIVGGFFILGFVIEFYSVDTPYAPYIHMLIVTVLLAGGALKLAVKKVMIATDKSDLKKARIQTSHLCARDTSNMDLASCSRTATESLAENFSDGVIAPVLFYMVFGLGGIFAYKAINTLDSMIGYKSKKYFYFGKVSARLDDVANYIPARISGLLLALSVMIMRTGNLNTALATYKKFAHTHNSPNAGVPESILAGALGIKLGGTRTYEDIGTITHWIGDGDENITPLHMQKSLKIYTGAIVIGAVLSPIVFAILSYI